MKRDIIFWICGVLWAVSSCTDVIELEFPAHDPLLVVNSVVSPDEEWKVQVSASKGLNNNDFYPLLDDAVVELYQGDDLLGQLSSKGNGIYHSKEQYPEAGIDYTLKVKHPGFNSTQSSIRMPEIPNISLPKVQYVEDTENKTSTGRWIQITTLITDDPARDDFYFARAFKKDSAYSYEEDQIVKFNSHRIIEFPVPINERGVLGMQMFTDRTFQGNKYMLTFLIEYYGNSEIHIQIGTISPALYNYARTYHRQTNYQESPFAQPNPVSNNITGGLGIFGGYSFKSYILKDG